MELSIRHHHQLLTHVISVDHTHLFQGCWGEIARELVFRILSQTAVTDWLVVVPESVADVFRFVQYEIRLFGMPGRQSS